MSVSVCFYFQVHQPFRIRKNYNFFSIGTDHYYEDHEANRMIMNRIAHRCYLPANHLMLDLIRRHHGKFKIAYSISGLALEQFELFCPKVIDSFRALANTGCVEFLCETYYHSLAFLRSKDEFRQQVSLHRKKINDLFGVNPTTFRNTELIYNNELAREVDRMGLHVILADGADHILGWRSPNFIYTPVGSENVKLLLKNYRLSDDIAFRFSNRAWKDFPLTAEKYARWIHNVAGNGNTVNLFMDYETFGEHQRESTGIFSFLRDLPGKILQHQDFVFKTPSEVAQVYKPIAKLNVPEFISWADTTRDLSAWVGNPLQNSALDLLYSMENDIKTLGDSELLHTWRKLSASDHNYYTCTKWSGDGDVHTYFNPHNSPHEAYIAYINVLNDLKLTVKERIAQIKIDARKE